MDALLRYANNPKIAANLRDQFPHPYTRRDAIDYLNYVRMSDIPMSFAVEHGGEAIGGIGFKLGVDIARLTVEMGYWLGEPFWGRGFATRAVAASSDWAFDNYKVVRIFARFSRKTSRRYGYWKSAGISGKGSCGAARSRTARFWIRSCTPSCGEPALDFPRLLA